MRALRLSIREQGLTLVELLVSTAILGLVAASVPVLMDTGFAGLARQRDSVHRELTYGVLFEEWALDVAGARTGMGITDGVVLTQSEGEVRYLVKGAEVYREMRKTGVVAWKAVPMRPLACLETGTTLTFQVSAGSAEIAVMGLERPLRAVATFRSVAP